MADSRLRELERRARSGDVEAVARLAEEERRRTPTHPKALLVGPCGKRGEALHVLQDHRDPGIDGGPRWEALCHRHKSRTRRLTLTEGHEPRWALILPCVEPEARTRLPSRGTPEHASLEKAVTHEEEPGWRCSPIYDGCLCGAIRREWMRRELARLGATEVCGRCAFGRRAEPFDSIRSGQLLALGMGIPNSAQTGLFTGAAS